MAIHEHGAGPARVPSEEGEIAYSFETIKCDMGLVERK